MAERPATPTQLAVFAIRLCATAELAQQCLGKNTCGEKARGEKKTGDADALLEPRRLSNVSAAAHDGQQAGSLP